MQPESEQVPSPLEQIEHTYEHLDRWKARSRNLEEPQPGSDLHADAAIWPGMPPAEVARMGLFSGVQHLNLARAALDQGEMFPIAHPSVLRGALLGSARAVWLLAPDDPVDRQQRALRTIHETHYWLLRFGREGAIRFTVPDPEAAIQDLAARERTLRGMWEERPGLPVTRKPRETEIVAAAADAAFTNPGQRAAVRSLWMQLSGDAHGLAWPIFTRPSTEALPLTRRPDNGRQMAEFSVGGDIEEIAEGFLAAFGMLRRGWSLFDQRCEAP